MDIKTKFLENEEMVNATLKSLITQEFKRMIESGLVSKADCFSFIEKQEAPNSTKSLLAIYTALSGIKLAGDKLEEPFYNLKDVLDKIKELKQESPAEAKKCPCNPGECVDTDCLCPEGCDCKNPSRMMVKLEQLDNLVSDRLEKMAYLLGNDGDHETAYLIERTLRDVKAQLKKLK